MTRGRFKKGVKQSLLFLMIFVAGSLVSGFYFHSQSRPHLTISGFPILKQKGYTVAYDGRSKVPLWTYEHLTEKKLQKKATRTKSHFCENQNIYPNHRSTLTDYYQSGYDRGHMVPAGDQQLSQDQLNETFLLSNICPQNAELNRGFWRKLERYTREQTAENKSVDVVTGPLYLPQMEGNDKVVKYKVIGANHVAVPTHFYKVIQINTPKAGSQIVGYIVPNAPIDSKTSIQEYEVSLTEIEKVTGLVFKSSAFSQKGLAHLIKDSI